MILIDEFYVRTSGPSSRIPQNYGFFRAFLSIDLGDMSTEETNGVFGEKEPELHEANNLINGQDVDKDTEDEVSTKSTRYLTLKNRKKTAKTRLTKARNQVTILTTGHPSTKTEIRRAVKKVKAECQIIEEIIYAMKKEVVLSDGRFEETDADVIVESLEKELSDIMSLVDTTIKAAGTHISERIANGEQESEASTILSSKVSENTKVTKLSHSSEPKSVDRSIPEIRQQEAKDAKERLDKLEEEQRALQQELQKKSETFELNRQRIKDARSIAKLNEARAKASVQEEQAIQGPTKLPASPVVLTSRSTRVKLKGVELPTFSGEDKTEFEAWNAAFTSVVDDTDIPVKEKMLRLQSCLRGKALETVKDLGFTSHAYERAKEKLTRRYGGKRRQSLAHLVTLLGLNKVRRHNLEDMEELLAIIDRILVAIRDSDQSGEMKSQHLGLTVKEKLPEEYVREYKYWLHDRGEEDSFEKLVEWIETRVQVMDEAKEETGQLGKNQNQKPGERRNRGFGTSSRERHCIVPKCKEDHFQSHSVKTASLKLDNVLNVWQRVISAKIVKEAESVVLMVVKVMDIVLTYMTPTGNRKKGNAKGL